jgi:hypothetical protein
MRATGTEYAPVETVARKARPNAISLKADGRSAHYLSRVVDRCGTIYRVSDTCGRGNYPVRSTRVCSSPNQIGERARSMKCFSSS